MGLIGCWLFALVNGLKMISMSPLVFLRRPKRWLRAISDYRGTLSPAPNSYSILSRMSVAPAPFDRTSRSIKA